MLSRELLREHPEEVRVSLQARRADVGLVERWLGLDEAWRNAITEEEELKRIRNERSREIGELKRAGQDADEAIAEVGRIKERLPALQAERERLEAELGEVELQIPNVLAEGVPEGSDESANRVERVVGEPPSFDFEPKAHWDLGVELGILDFERAAKISGARFAVARGMGARLERALAQLMLDLHTERHGYLELSTPYIVHRRSLVGTGQLPKFEADLFALAGTDFYLIPTAEVPVTNLHREEVLEEADLPRRYVAWTPCFRAEAGSHGRDVRGLIRQHQFHKVELVQITTPETSADALERLTGHAEAVLQTLELPYRVVCLSSGDTGFAATKTYDLEVWLPGLGAYREISSCSNTGDFQARRAELRYRPAEGGKPRFAHTLNGSGLAVGRTLIAVLENGQRADGSIEIPVALRPYLGGRERIEPGE